MTRKHFEKLAKLVADHRDRLHRDETLTQGGIEELDRWLTETVVDLCASDNPRFNAGRFRAAIDVAYYNCQK